MTRPRLTVKQIEIMALLKSGNPDGSTCSIYDLMDRLSYRPQRTAVAHSLTILDDKGFINRLPMERRTGYDAPVAVFNLTPLGESYFGI